MAEADEAELDRMLNQAEVESRQETARRDWAVVWQRLFMMSNEVTGFSAEMMERTSGRCPSPEEVAEKWGGVIRWFGQVLVQCGAAGWVDDLPGITPEEGCARELLRLSCQADGEQELLLQVAKLHRLDQLRHAFYSKVRERLRQFVDLLLNRARETFGPRSSEGHEQQGPGDLPVKRDTKLMPPADPEDVGEKLVKEASPAMTADEDGGSLDRDLAALREECRSRRRALDVWDVTRHGNQNFPEDCVRELWQKVRSVAYGTAEKARPREPDKIPDVPAAQRALDEVVRWCEEQENASGEATGVNLRAGEEEATNGNAPLDGKQIKQLADGLLGAFTSFDDLARVVRVALDEPLYHIVDQRASLTDQVWQLVQWAEARGKVRDLFLAAVAQVPGNVRLRAAAEAVFGKGVLDDIPPTRPSLQPETPTAQRPEPPSRDVNVKILFLAANPSATTRLALDEEIRAIDAKIQSAKHRDRLDLKSHWAVRLDDLSGILLRHSPQVVHFSGHGDKSGAIILVGSNGQAKAVPAKALAGLFRVLKDNVRVVVLNACYSATQAKAIVKEIDCAVGMSDPIDDDHAIAFAAEFYQALAFGRSVQEAFDLGVVRLVGEGVADAEQLVKLHKRRGVKPAEIVLVVDNTLPPP
jgi:hypothetical protein